MKEDYPLFVKWTKVLDWIMDTVEKYPKSVRFTIGSRTVNLSMDVLEGIIEAIYRKPRIDILENINLYIEKLRVFFRISYERRYISLRQYEFISGELNDTGKMFGGWIKSEKGKRSI